jgi:PBSX family phage terminase large subunit
MQKKLKLFYDKRFIEHEKPIFNPLYWHLSEYLNNPKIRFIFVYGGSSAAKTYSIMQVLSIENKLFSYNVYAMRKVGSTIKDSIYTDFKSFNEKLNRKSNNITIIQNEIRTEKSKIRFSGIDDPEKLKGIADFTKVYADEITEFSLEDFKQIKKRLRGKPGQQIICSWNPISKNHWIKKKVLDLESWIDLPLEIEGNPKSKLNENSNVWINSTGNSILIKTTYLDNYWIVGHNSGGGFRDNHVISDFEHDKIYDEESYKIYALAEWGDPVEGLIFIYKKNWFQYSELPDIDLYETYGLDFGGGGVNEKRKCYPELQVFDEPDGSSTTVLVRLLINKSSMSCYIKLLLYKAYISPDDLSKVCKEYCIESDGNYIKKKNILADNARADKIRDLLNDGLSVIGAKTKEGSSNKVTSGIDIMKKYKIFIHKDDIPAIVEANNFRWDVTANGELTGNVADKFKDFWDAVRYALVNYELYQW